MPPARGDDAIVEIASEGAGQGQDVTVVTADRELKRRVQAAGARTVGPSWLRDRL
jgi:rRNA-processing protein FCF1